jgi:predicted amidophosphoribosyltransferase
VSWLSDAMVVAMATPIGALRAGAVVTWAPTTPARRRERGFDHAELLARRVACRLGVPARALLRRAPGTPQTGLSGATRRRGPAFSARARAASPIVPAFVVLVDDVATTGATLRSAAAVLRSAGTEEILGLTAARTPGPPSSLLRI